MTRMSRVETWFESRFIIRGDGVEFTQVFLQHDKKFPEQRFRNDVVRKAFLTCKGMALQFDETGRDPENPLPLNSGICLQNSKASMI